MDTLQHPTRKHLYRIPEREPVKTEIDKALIGRTFLASRIVTRLGYAVSYHDFKYSAEATQLLVERAIKLLRLHKGWDKDDWIIPEKREKYERLLVEKAKEFVQEGVPPHWKPAAWKVLQNKYYQEHDIPQERAIWYSHFENPQWSWSDQPTLTMPIPVKIIGRKGCWTGGYCSPSSSYDSYSGEYDSDPGGLMDAVWHNLYEVSYRQPDYQANLRFDANGLVLPDSWDDGYSHNMSNNGMAFGLSESRTFLHPADILEQLTPESYAKVFNDRG